MGGIFQHIPIGPRLKGCIDVFLGFVNRKGQDFRFGESALDFFYGLQAMHFGHGQIHQNEIRCQFFDAADGISAVYGLSNDLKFGIGTDERSQSFSQNGVIFCNDQTIRFFHGRIHQKSEASHKRIFAPMQ